MVTRFMDWHTMPEGKEKYCAYLASREWALKKEAVRARSGGRCERCKVNNHEQTHHLSYARKYKEDLNDLQGICRDCHEFISGKSNFDPSKKPTNEKTSVYLTAYREAGRLSRLAGVADFIIKKMPEMVWFIDQLHDHKGILTVNWNVEPCQLYIDCVGEAWDAFGEAAEYVHHNLPNKTGFGALEGYDTEPERMLLEGVNCGSYTYC